MARTWVLSQLRGLTEGHLERDWLAVWVTECLLGPWDRVVIQC